jgi:uncharacterized OsmC-like protein
MPGIEESGFPLVFKVPDGVSKPPDLDESLAGEQTATRVYVRALKGMQKEAVVAISTAAGQRTWRMVCDEGPYLDGTDLAPFPLAFYSAGMQFSFLSELLQHARAHDVTIKSLALSQDNYYSMNGSALRGTMIGGAKPAELLVKIESDAPAEIITKLIHLAEQSSPAHAVMREVLANTFALSFNDKPLPLADLKPSPVPVEDRPDKLFEAIRPDDQSEFLADIITKLTGAERIEGVEGGASSSLQPVQKRTLHIHGEAKLLAGTVLETKIQLFTPIGSTFRFVCDGGPDAGTQEITPPPLAYLSAGVGFCYMTQLGRYAHITKQALKGYQIIQDNVYTLTDGSDDGEQIAHILPVNTQVFYEADESDEMAQKTVQMGERTCFLHAAMRGSYPSMIQVELNGDALLLNGQD